MFAYIDSKNTPLGLFGFRIITSIDNSFRRLFNRNAMFQWYANAMISPTPTTSGFHARHPRSSRWLEVVPFRSVDPPDTGLPNYTPIEI